MRNDLQTLSLKNTDLDTKSVLVVDQASHTTAREVQSSDHHVVVAYRARKTAKLQSPQTSELFLSMKRL